MAENTKHLRYDPTAVLPVRERDIEFRRVGDRSLLAHVYEPQGSGPFPMLIDMPRRRLEPVRSHA